MLQNSDKISFLTGNIDTLNNIQNIKVLPIFSDLVINFLSILSTKLLTKFKTKDYMDIASFAFWIRKANIEALKKHYDITNRIGKGIALHFAPSNVPVNFAVSLTYALIAGNPCVIRVSNKEFEQVNIICKAINEIIENDIPEIKNYINIIKYEHDEEITQELSKICDIRIIWGGDNTIKSIRQIPVPPRTTELTFADRHSVLIINSNKYLESDAKKTAQSFYIDTFHTDQNACTSPRLIVWTGNKIKEAKKLFWDELEKLVSAEYILAPIKSIDKLDSFCRYSASHKGVKLIKNNNSIYRIELNSIEKDLMDYKDNSGYFFEYSTNNLSDITPVLTKKCQTISYLGINPEEIKNIVYSIGVKGVDRIVPIGQTMDISFIWDGYDMIETMSRIVYVK